MDDLALNFSTHVMRARTRAGLMPDEAAELLGLHWHMLCEYESGTYYPGDREAARVLAKLEELAGFRNSEKWPLYEYFVERHGLHFDDHELSEILKVCRINESAQRGDQ
jgi:ribosome-binding protein aMBF1 (putative translation factor)